MQVHITENHKRLVCVYIDLNRCVAIVDWIWQICTYTYKCYIYIFKKYI